MKTILDFSDENPDVNWVQISQIPNLEGVVLKVSEGITIQDKMFGIRFREALTENIPVKGLYLFYHPSDDPNRQAENYINWRKSVTADNTIPAIVDLEWDENPKEWANVPESKRYSDLKTLIARLEAENFEVMIYTSHAFMTQYLPQADFLAIYKLWVAWYEAAPPLLPSPWNVWTWWQYTGSGNVQGVQGEIDISYVMEVTPSAAA